jgi:predicted kinase
VNGPPGVGKSALGRRYVDDHPLALLLEIDAFRVALGGWQEHDESKLIARKLAIAVAEAHLRGGHDVVVPQYLGRTEFIATLDEVAQRVGARFVEILLTDTEAAVVDRFRTRRAELARAGVAHPQLDVSDAGVAAAVADARERLETIAFERTRTRMVAAGDGLEPAYRALCRHVDGRDESS